MTDTPSIPTVEEMLTDPTFAAVVETLRPYIPAIQRTGRTFYNDVIRLAISGEWDQLNTVAWKHMTENERDAASNALLVQAREAVDNAYEREKLAREIAYKAVGTILLSFL